MSRIYTAVVNMTITAAGGDVDWATLLPGANRPIKLRGMKVSQYTEEGDAQEEGVEFQLKHLPVTVTNGSGGAAGATPQPVDENDAAATFTWRTNDTTLATTSGTARILEEFTWNERNTPLEMWWPDLPFAPRVQNAGAIVLRQLNTLADDMSVQLTLFIEEL